MKIQIERNSEFQDINFLKVKIGDDEFKLEEELGQLVITKISFTDSALKIFPKVSNEIGVK